MCYICFVCVSGVLGIGFVCVGTGVCAYACMCVLRVTMQVSMGVHGCWRAVCRVRVCVCVCVCVCAGYFVLRCVHVWALGLCAAVCMCVGCVYAHAHVGTCMLEGCMVGKSVCVRWVGGVYVCTLRCLCEYLGSVCTGSFVLGVHMWI